MVRPASISAVTISPSEWFHLRLRGLLSFGADGHAHGVGLKDHDSQKLTILRFLGLKTQVRFLAR